MKQVNESPLEYSIDLELNQIPSSISLEKIDEDNGNPLKLWENLGKPILNPKEVQDLIISSTPKVINSPIDYQDNSLHLTGELGINDIHFYIIKTNKTKDEEDIQ
jgi:xylan 1,4-beta-xylosidase